jgi:hypothetical protein
LPFEQKQKFYQQAARVVRRESAPPTVFELKLQGQPVSAESRQCYRVSCLGAGIKATVADEKDCEVVDVSATGLAFYATSTYEIGRQVRITFFYNGDEHAGQGTVQSMRRVSAKLIRYGVHCGDTKSKTDTLARSLSSINQSIQRDHCDAWPARRSQAIAPRAHFSELRGIVEVAARGPRGLRSNPSAD